MIAHMTQCGPYMLWPEGLGAVGGLLMGLGAVKEKSGACKTGFTLVGAFCIFVGFMGLAYRGIERCHDPRAVCLFWSFAIAAPILMLVAFFFLKRQVLCALGLSLRTRIAGLLNLIERWLRSCLRKARGYLTILNCRRKRGGK
jgi:hypothetical protein